MNIMDASDFHLAPDEELPLPAQQFFALAALSGDRVVLNGDIFDIIIHGLRPYYTSRALLSFRHHLPPQGCYLLLGNHSIDLTSLKKLMEHLPLEGLDSLPDGVAKLSDITELLAKEPRVRVMKSLDLFSDNYPWHFEHGDRFACDWGPLHPLYDGIAKAALKVSPKLWYRLCKRAGWVPSVYKANGEKQKYTKLTGIIWDRALEYGQKNHCNICVGHTHTAMVRQTAFVTEADAGDIRDGSYVVIQGSKAEIRWLK